MDATPTPADLDDTPTLELSWDEVVAALAALEGARLAVRVVERSDPETLVAVFRGHLGAPTPGSTRRSSGPSRPAAKTSPATWKTQASTCTASAFTEALPIQDGRFCTSSRAR
jgi:hypothetical protein